jgi:pimeloyl-ACP methyl ester carboxylesterase
MAANIKDGQYASLPNGTRLHYASAGEAGRPLLLFLHGFPEFWFAWNEQLAEFGQDYFAVAPDLRGFNLSDMPSDVAAYKPRLIMQDITQLIAYLGYSDCIMVAHDWGGAVAWNIAITHPEFISKLIIINATHPYPFAMGLVNDSAQQAASAYMNWLRNPGSEQALAKDNFRVMEQFMLGMGEQPEWFDDAIRERYHACWARGLTGGVNYYRASPLHPPTPEDAGAARLSLDPANFHVRVPVRVIWGEKDKALLPSLLDGLDDLVDDLNIERLPNASHWVVHEYPATINEYLHRFLSE